MASQVGRQGKGPMGQPLYQPSIHHVGGTRGNRSTAAADPCKGEGPMGSALYQSSIRSMVPALIRRSTADADRQCCEGTVDQTVQQSSIHCVESDGYECSDANE